MSRNRLVFRAPNPLSRTSRAEFSDPGQIGDPIADELSVRDSPGSAMRPVHLHPISYLAAEQGGDGNAEGLRLRIEQRVLDGSDRLADDGTGGRPCRVQQIHEDRLVVENGPAGDPRGKASIAVLTPGEPKPSSNSLQPTMPSSVVTLQKW